MEAKRVIIRTKLQGKVKEAKRETRYILLQREMELLTERFERKQPAKDTTQDKDPHALVAASHGGNQSTAKVFKNGKRFGNYGRGIWGDGDRKQ